MTPTDSREPDVSTDILCETLSWADRWRVRRWLSAGHKVAVFDFDYNLKRYRWLRDLINAGVVERIYIHPNRPEHGIAIDQTAAIFESLRGCHVVRAAKWMCGTPEIDAVFKKCLLREIFRVVHMNAYVHHRSVKNAAVGRKTAFYARTYRFAEWLLKEHGGHELFEIERGARVHGGGARNTVLRAYHSIGVWLGTWPFLGAYGLALLRARFFRRGERAPRSDLAAFAIDQVAQLDTQGTRAFDFVLDGERIHKDNSVFVASIAIPDAWRESAPAGIKVIEVSGRGFAASLGRRARLALILRGWVALFWSLLSLGGPSSFFRAMRETVRALIRWETIRSRTSAAHYVYTNQEGPAQVAMNAVARSMGVTTCMYSSFLGGGYLHSHGDDLLEFRHTHWAFLNFDLFAAINHDVIRYNGLHSQSVRKYVPIGSLVASLALEPAMDGADKVETREPDDGLTRVVAFFDTTFVDSTECHTNYEDALAFYRDIERLLDAHVDVHAIVKPAKDEAFFIDPLHQWSSPSLAAPLMEVWTRLKEHPRVTWAGAGASVPRVIARSDIVVTHCFSSPTGEALAARKKAIWYESGNKHEGRLYADIPGLVIHGFDALSDRLSELLWNVDQAEYSHYLTRHVKGRIEPFLDGAALERLRNLLTSPVDTTSKKGD